MRNPISDLIKPLVDDWFDSWSSAHFIGALSAMWIFQHFTSNVMAGLYTFGLAFLWEVFQGSQGGVEAEYGSFEAYWRNTISDMLIAIFCIAILW